MQRHPVGIHASNPRRDDRFHLHKTHLDLFVDTRKSAGLEIGAFDLPLVDADEGVCEFADHRTTQELVSLAAQTHGHSPEYVAPTNYDLKRGYGSISRNFNWIAACHVIEHVPDPLGWLNTLASKLLEGGIVFLVIPDKRYVLDHHRRVTSLTDVLDWHERRLERPSFLHVFDHDFNSITPLDPAEIWSGRAMPHPKRDYKSSFSLARSALDKYIDVHCSVFTPESFVDVFEPLSTQGALRLKIEDVRPTNENHMDFSVVLRAVK